MPKEPGKGKGKERSAGEGSGNQEVPLDHNQARDSGQDAETERRVAQLRAQEMEWMEEYANRMEQRGREMDTRLTAWHAQATVDRAQPAGAETWQATSQEQDYAALIDDVYNGVGWSAATSLSPYPAGPQGSAPAAWHASGPEGRVQDADWFATPASAMDPAWHVPEGQGPVQAEDADWFATPASAMNPAWHVPEGQGPVQTQDAGRSAMAIPSLINSPEPVPPAQAQGAGRSAMAIPSLINSPEPVPPAQAQGAGRSAM
ncbi:hypothetical protein AB0E08_13650, partial [Streptomyces sp. NPDC048281]